MDPKKYDERTQSSATKRPNPPDAGSSEGLDFKDWDWRKHDKEFYEAYQRMPESREQSNYNQVKWNRYMHAKAGGNPKYDFSKRNFMWVMRKEVAIFAISICLGLTMPYWWHYRIHNDPNLRPHKNQANLPPP